MKRCCAFLLVLILCFLPRVHAEEKDANLPRDEKGAIIQKDVRVDVPEDRKILQVAPNVVRVQEVDRYLYEKVDKLQNQVETLEQQIHGLEEALRNLKQDLSSKGAG